MAEKLIPSEFTPSGGMNSDDSIVAPTPGLEGQVSLFQNGDYRYALNMRIGSSRDDSMGDGEAFKSTRKVNDYFIRDGAFQNPGFIGSISPWQQILDGSGWEWGPGTVGFLPPSIGISPNDHSIAYQPFGGDSNQTQVEYSYSMPMAFVANFILQAVFLNGTTEIGHQDLDSRTGELFEIFKGKVLLDVPVGCTAIGVRVQGSVIGFFSFNCALYFFQPYGWIAGTAPADINKTIGRYEDNEFLKVWQCIANTDTLRYYDLITDAVYEVLRWPGLNWNLNSFVKCSKLDNWLVMTDRNNAPRLIDTDTISDLFSSLGDDFREFHIAFHKWSPVAAPTVKQYYDGSTNNSDALKDKMWQFSYRYIYYGNLQSRWSPVSVAASTMYDDSDDPGINPITAISVYMPGLFFDENGLIIENNFFNHNNAKCRAAIEKIQIAVRDSGIGIWRLWKTINPSSNIQLFDGKLDNTPIPTDDFSQPFDTVPFKAGTVEAIDNRFVFGDILEELPPASPVSVENIFVIDNNTNSPDWNSVVPSVFTGVATTDDKNEIANRNVITQRTFKSRGIYKLGIQYFAKNGWRSAVYTAENWVYEIPKKFLFSPATSEPNYALCFKFVDGFVPPEWAVAYQIVRTNCLNIDSFMYGTCNEIQPIVDDLDGYISGLTQSSPELATAIRDHFLNASLITDKEFNDYLDVLKNNPIYYGIIQNVRKNKTTGITGNASRLYIDIRNWYNGSRKDNTGVADNPMNNLLYNYRPGDRVRFIGSHLSDPAADTKFIYDVKILDFTGDGIIIERPPLVVWVPTKNTTGSIRPDDYLIEVYTPKEQNDSDFVFYESGEWFPVRYPGTERRTWSKSDWTYTTPSAITASHYGDVTVFNNQPFYFGDCSRFYKFIYNDFRNNSSGVVYLRHIPSMNNVRDATYNRWERSNGRPYPAYIRQPVVKFKTTMARFSGKIVEQSFINNLNRMRDEDQFVYPSEYGRITDLVNTNNAQVESVGAVLLAIGEREAWSIYVNRTTSEDLSGRTQVLLSDRVLGSFNALLGSFGSWNPESITKNKGRVYWWCEFYGAWIRYGRDGLTNLSAYKMQNWFSDIAIASMVNYQLKRTVVDSYEPFLSLYGNTSSGTPWTLGSAPFVIATNARSTLLYLNYAFKIGVSYTLIADYEYSGASTSNRVSIGVYNSADIGFDENIAVFNDGDGTGSVQVSFIGQEGMTRYGLLLFADNGTKRLQPTRIQVTFETSAVIRPRAVSGFDSYNDELVTFNNDTSLPETLRGYDDYKGSLFSERDKRWKSCHSYEVDMFASLGQKMFLFKDGNVYVHEEGTDYRTFFGIKYPVKIEPVFNALMKDMKVWEALTIIATDAWEIERVLSEYRGQKTVQQSHIPLSQVKDKEDTYYAPFFKDENSLGSLYRGNRMRSKAIKVLLNLDPAVVTRALLHYVQAEFQNSAKTP
jgi:hypothetical protein